MKKEIKQEHSKKGTVDKLKPFFPKNMKKELKNWKFCCFDFSSQIPISAKSKEAVGKSIWKNKKNDRGYLVVNNWDHANNYQIH